MKSCCFLHRPIHANFKILHYHPHHPTHTHTRVTDRSFAPSFTRLFTLKASGYSSQIIPAEI